MLPAPARDALDALLRRVDRAIPGRVDGFYVVGSVSLGGFRRQRSDVDFVATISGALGDDELRRLRRAHLACCAAAVGQAVPRRSWPLICNGVYVTAADLARSPLAVTPLASHVAGRFVAGEGFDVNPVTWHTLAEHGIAVRGPQPQGLGVHTDDAELRAWTLANLDGYWRRWAAATRGHGWMAVKATLRRFATWGVLGAPRLHYTIQTGAIATKHAAARYALEVFDARWHPLIQDALAFLRGEPAHGAYRDPVRRRRDSADFVACVVDAAQPAATRAGLRTG